MTTARNWTLASIAMVWTHGVVLLIVDLPPGHVAAVSVSGIAWSALAVWLAGEVSR